MINYPLRDGKWVLYEGGTRVPFIVKDPGIKAHSYCHIPMIGYATLPTISALTGNKKRFLIIWMEPVLLPYFTIH